VANRPKRPGNTPVEQQERSIREVDAHRPVRRVISGPGAADFIARREDWIGRGLVQRGWHIPARNRW
jgi:hypothetical protein